MMFRQKNTFLAIFLIFCLIIIIEINYAQEIQINETRANETSLIGEQANDAEDYYFTNGEFSEEYNFTNESISNIVITIPSDYFYVEAGTELLSSVKIMNLGSKRREDVVLDFEIRDSENNVILAKKETVAVETQANFVRIFHIPVESKNGEYSIQVNLTHANGKTAVAETSFEVKDKRAELYKIIYFIAGILAGLAIIIFLIYKSGGWMEKAIIRRKIRRIVRNKLGHK